MNQTALSVFEQREVLGNEFRIYGTVDDPLFLVKDVAEWIEYDKSKSARLVSAVDEDERVRHNVSTPGGIQETWFLTEDGLYEVLMQSRKPIAKQFKKKVKAILKEIRTTGGYIAGEEQMSDDELLAKALMVAQNKIANKDKIIAQQQAQIEESKPKVLFADAVTSSSTSVLVGNLAKVLKQNGINIGSRRLFTWLRENGYLIKRTSDWNMPTQRSMDAGLFEIKETVTTRGGISVINRTPMVTGKGQLYFVNKFLKEKVYCEDDLV